MIALRRMNEEEFHDFLEYFIVDYGIEIEANYKQNGETARLIAEQEIKSDLPEGIHTEDNILLCIDLVEKEDRRIIGYLWYKINKLESSAFINDFHVRKEYRNRGYRKESMMLLEKQLKADGIRQIKLRVAFTNEKALALYKELAFNITGINMAKNLMEDGES